MDDDGNESFLGGGGDINFDLGEITQPIPQNPNVTQNKDFSLNSRLISKENPFTNFRSSGNKDAKTSDKNPNEAIESRFQYNVDESKVKFNDPLAHNRQLEAYKNKQRKKAWNKRLSSKRKNKGSNVMTMQGLWSKELMEKKELLGKEMLKLTNEFRKK